MADLKIEMPQDEVDEIIRNKRKARDPKGLFSCKMSGGKLNLLILIFL
jgi:hypothetical protein